MQPTHVITVREQGNGLPGVGDFVADGPGNVYEIVALPRGGAFVPDPRPGMGDTMTVRVIERPERSLSDTDVTDCKIEVMHPFAPSPATPPVNAWGEPVRGPHDYFAAVEGAL